MVALITDRPVSFLNGACLQNIISYLTHYDPVYWLFCYFHLCLSNKFQKHLCGLSAIDTWVHYKHLTQIKTSEACLKQHLFASSLASSHLHNTGSNFSISHICRIRSFDQVMKYQGRVLSYVNPFSLPCFVLYTSGRADIDTIRCLSTELNTRSGYSKVL